MYKYLFGPVPSRRLGMSLGVDLVPRKVCSLDCVYCECGATTKLTLDRKEYILFDRVTAELEDYFIGHPDPDYITFSGSGEPTLNSRIGDVLHFIKSRKPGIPVAVLTNGTLLSRKEVRNEIMDADVVLPSLDAATYGTFTRINRPHPELDLETYVRGLVDFRNEFKGQVWLEIFILPGYNDNTGDLEALRDACVRIRPDRIQLNTLDRPGTLGDLIPAGRAQLERIAKEWNMGNVEIIAAPVARKEVVSYRPDREQAILETISRRPCTVDDLVQILGLHLNEVNKYLGVLEEDDRIETFRQQRGVFYRLKPE
ncbi:MAG: radical SAM protein [Bacteroidales bacterium]|nr:radical SAM protein [Bacteroidales bacterium]